MKVRNIVVLAAIALAAQACGQKDEAVVPAEAVVTADEATAEAAAAAMPEEEVDATTDGAMAATDGDTTVNLKVQRSIKTVTGMLQGIEVGDNMYVKVKLADGTDATYLCGANQCQGWMEAGGLPGNLAGKTVTIDLGKGQQVDGEGTVMGEMDEALSITVAP
jgi:predicted small lipoprotein YifL